VKTSLEATARNGHGFRKKKMVTRLWRGRGLQWGGAHWGVEGAWIQKQLYIKKGFGGAHTGIQLTKRKGGNVHEELSRVLGRIYLKSGGKNPPF